MPKRSQVFISYSHADSDHFRRLMIHLRPFEQESLVDVWADTKIKTGQQWRQEIQSALNRASVAVLLISADFLASDFIVKNELPPLLEAAKKDGIKIFPVILKPCAFESIERLSKYHAINPPSKPLISMHAASREKLWTQLASSITEALHLPAEAVDTAVVPYETELYFDARDFISPEIANPERIKKYFVYSYQHIDFLNFMPSAIDSLKMAKNFEQILRNVKDRFTEAGWEGDGEIRLLWLPPFVGVGVEDTFGHLLWHVKQSNDGISWIASSVPLQFPSLSEEMRGGVKSIAKSGELHGKDKLSDVIARLDNKDFAIGETPFTLKDIFVYLGESLAAGVTSDSIGFQIDEYVSYDNRINVFRGSHSPHEITGPLIIMGLVTVHPPSGDHVELLYLTEQGKLVLNEIDSGA